MTWGGLVAVPERSPYRRTAGDAKALLEKWRRVRFGKTVPTLTETAAAMGWTERQTRTAYNYLRHHDRIHTRYLPGYKYLRFVKGSP